MRYMENPIRNLMKTMFYYEPIWLLIKIVLSFSKSIPHKISRNSVELWVTDRQIWPAISLSFYFIKDT